ncbi:phage holin family protein [Pseudomonas sp. GD03860]|uniref:putative holin n=1 Tax=Pseudomonas sp. GD03860 TaxID=2975389 RepID=UPI0024497570|nr:putative holin [Pseudomonas sp. GD03860]MDH0640631.1 phage holin family protein [Pseudomonas sp. GD03860]
MAEPSTGALAVTGVLASVGLGAVFPQLDLAALVGAFGGAFFYVVFAKDISTWRRVGYLLAGWIGGYFGSAELMGRAWTQTSGFSAFICGAFCVVLLSSTIEWVQTGQMPRWLQWFFRRFAGGKEG